jgi:RNA polymerase sigma-70 factor (ECF subfamily)
MTPRTTIPEPSCPQNTGLAPGIPADSSQYIKVEGTATDLELIRRVKAGEHEPFNELMTRYNRKMYSVVFGLVRSHEDARDLVQETFIRAYENIRRFDEQYRFYTWLYRIGVNLCFTFLKRRKLAPVSIESDDPEAGETELPDTRSAPIAEQSDRQRNIERALALLPVEQRLAIELRTYQGMSYAEIAEVMHTSIGTVMSRLSRARDKLRESLRDYVTGVK